MTEGRYIVNIIMVDEETYTATLDITKSETTDAGSYKLTARNDLGELNASVSLIVNGENLNQWQGPLHQGGRDMSHD